MQEITFAIPEQLKDKHSLYLSFLLRVLVIKWVSSYKTKILKKDFYSACRGLNIPKGTYATIWSKARVGQIFQAINSEYAVFVWKERLMWEKGYYTMLPMEYIWYYKFLALITSINSTRPVTQTKETLEEIRQARKKKWAIRDELNKRLDTKMHGRGMRRLAKQSWCCLKTVSNRLKKSDVTIVKRYDTFHDARINKTNLYYKQWVVYWNFNTKKFTVSKNHHKSLRVSIFLNDCLHYNKLPSNLYSLIEVI